MNHSKNDHFSLLLVTSDDFQKNWAHRHKYLLSRAVFQYFLARVFIYQSKKHLISFNFFETQLILRAIKFFGGDILKYLFLLYSNSCWQKMCTTICNHGYNILRLFVFDQTVHDEAWLLVANMVSTSCRTTYRKLWNIRKTSKLHGIIA